MINTLILGGILGFLFIATHIGAKIQYRLECKRNANERRERAINQR